MSIVARSSRWGALRATTRVYVVVSKAAGAGAEVRDVAFFIVRRRTNAKSDRSAGGDVVFSISNARAVVGSFWVHGVDSRGFADIFKVDDLLATAIGNWSRYLNVLKVAHALAAAMHPLDLSPRQPPARGTRTGGRAKGLWTGGQRPSRRVRAIFRLLIGALGSPISYAGAKKTPLVVDFIAHELRNPSLARRWREVTGKLPLKVPDRYAAAAHEEAKFTRVLAPRISAARVAMVDGTNSADEAGAVVAGHAPTLTVDINGSGTVTGRTYTYGQNIDCSGPPGRRGPGHDPCQASFPTGATWETLTATAGSGFLFAGWKGCDAVPAGGCRVLMGNSDRTVEADFNQPATLYITNPGHGSGQVVHLDCILGACQAPGDFTCDLASGETCSHRFSVGESVDLEEFAGFNSVASWEGCDSTSGADCTVTIGPNGTRITALFEITRVNLQVHQDCAIGFVTCGHVTSNPPGIDCPPTCAADFAFGQSIDLTATPDPGFDIAGWDGCDRSSDTICTVDTRSGGGTASGYGFDHRGALVHFRQGAVITRVAGNGRVCANPPNCGDGGIATIAQLGRPRAVAVDSTGNLYIADLGNSEVRRVSRNGTITRIAGNGTWCTNPPSCGDGGPATSAELRNPRGVAVDSVGNVYIADSGPGIDEVRKVSPDGTITRFAGDGTQCSAPPNCNDGGPATSAQLSGPAGVAVDSAGNIYIADTGDNEIRKVSTDGTITRFAGDGIGCSSAPTCSDDGPATSALLGSPEGVAVDSAGNVYIADTGDYEIRRVSTDGTITPTAGDGTECLSPPDCGNGQPATGAQLYSPAGVAAGSDGKIYIADAADNEVRVATPGGTIAQYAGSGTACSTAPGCGDGGGATSAQLSGPEGVAVDSAGKVYVADTDDNEVRRVG